MVRASIFVLLGSKDIVCKFLVDSRATPNRVLNVLDAYLIPFL